jgi:hypothetical protein
MTQAQHTRRQYKGGSRRNGGCPYFSLFFLNDILSSSTSQEHFTSFIRKVFTGGILPCFIKRL